MPDGIFRPGEKVPTTGVYTATHHHHRLPHEVFAVEGDEFPSCRKCGDGIRFALLQSADHIDSDRDFSKAKRSPKTKKARAANKRSD
jgi:hypothetical protein